MKPNSRSKTESMHVCIRRRNVSGIDRRLSAASHLQIISFGQLFV